MKRALIFTFSKRFVNTADILIKSVHVPDNLDIDVYPLYLAEDSDDVCSLTYEDTDNIYIESIVRTSTSGDVFLKDVFDDRLSEERSPVDNKWIQKIDSDEFESRSLLYNRAKELIDDGYDQIVICDADYFILNSDRFLEILNTAPGDTITGQFDEVYRSTDLIPDMLQTDPTVISSIPDLDKYMKIQGECIQTITMSSDEFKSNVKGLLSRLADISPGDWMWDMYRMTISSYVSEAGCCNNISKSAQLSAIFACIGQCVDGTTVDAEPDNVLEMTSVEILNMVQSHMEEEDSKFKEYHSVSDSQIKTLITDIEKLKTYF